MKKYYKERFKAQQKMIIKTAPQLEVNEIIEKVKEELPNLIPNAIIIKPARIRKP